MTTVHLTTAVLTAADYALPAVPKARMPLPAGVAPFQLNWPYIIVIGACHVMALLAFMPGTFSWSGFGVALLGTHAFVVIAMSCLQETPARWVAIHRRHHQFAD